MITSTFESPPPAVLRREHAERDPALVGLDVGRLRHLERAQRVGLGVGLAHDRRKDVLGEITRLELQGPLLVREGEINGHVASSWQVGTDESRDAPGHCRSASLRQRTGGERTEGARGKRLLG